MSDPVISEDARTLLGGVFSMGRGSMTFHTPSRITPRAKAAFDELVAAGILSVENFNRFGSIIYKSANVELCHRIGTQVLVERAERPLTDSWAIVGPEPRETPKPVSPRKPHSGTKPVIH